ncbi:MAG: hypothetical protein ACODAJ_02560, partial [Planctomycetota bacterium]
PQGTPPFLSCNTQLLSITPVEDGADYRETVCRAHKNLKLMHEPLSNQRLGEAKRLLTQADVVIFLGFAYDAKNLEQLDIGRNLARQSRRNPAIYGTVCGLTARQKQQTEALFREKGITNPAPKFRDDKSLSLLRYVGMV